MILWPVSRTRYLLQVAHENVRQHLVNLPFREKKFRWTGKCSDKNKEGKPMQSPVVYLAPLVLLDTKLWDDSTMAALCALEGHNFVPYKSLYVRADARHEVKEEIIITEHFWKETTSWFGMKRCVRGSSSQVVASAGTTVDTSGLAVLVVVRCITCQEERTVRA